MQSLRRRVQASPAYRWWALAALLIGFFSVGISITILTAVLPDIAGEFDVGAATIAWVVTGPMLVMGVLTPTMGKAGDLLGRKRIYLVGWAIALGFALASAVAWSAGSLIAFRVLGAAAGAATGPASMALILATFDPAERVKALGLWAFVGAGAPVLGLVVGGPLVDLVGWRWIFGIQLPLGLPCLAAAWFVLRADEPAPRPRFDIAGSVTLGAGMGGLLYGLNRGGAEGWTRPDVVVALLAVPVLWAVFVVVERRHPAPLVPLEYFRRREVTIPVLIQSVSHVPYMGCFFISPFFLHSVLNYDNTATAYALLPRPLANSLMSMAAGFVVVRVGERVAAGTGMAVLFAGMVVLTTLGPSSTFAHVGVAQALTGAGLGLAYPGLASTVANAVRREDFGVISAVQNMAWTVGAVAGMQGLQTFQQVRAGAVGEAAAFQQTFALGAAITLVALVLTFWVKPMHRGVEDDESTADQPPRTLAAPQPDEVAVPADEVSVPPGPGSGVRPE